MEVVTIYWIGWTWTVSGMLLDCWGQYFIMWVWTDRAGYFIGLVESVFYNVGGV